MSTVFQKTKVLSDVHFTYCPGCTHGIIHRLVAESLEELGLHDNAIGFAPVGCAVFAYNFFNCDMQQAAHGRLPAAATGAKRVLPTSTVFTYQGDGDLASIGIAEIIHAAMRGEKITTIFVNNAIYGMTGGQMAPTTLVAQKATTAPGGRDEEHYGYPLRVSELLATIPKAVFIERVSMHSVKHIIQAKKAIKRAFEIQTEGLGFSMVEVLSACPTNWGLKPVEALKWIESNMIPYYPLGNFRTPEEVRV